MGLLICRKCNNLHGGHHTQCMKCKGPLEPANVNEEKYSDNGTFCDKSKQ